MKVYYNPEKFPNFKQQFPTIEDMAELFDIDGLERLELIESDCNKVVIENDEEDILWDCEIVPNMDNFGLFDLTEQIFEENYGGNHDKLPPDYTDYDIFKEEFSIVYGY